MTSKNQINPAKLMLSKWTSLTPTNRECHFLITGVVSEKPGHQVYKIESVLTGNSYHVKISDLKNASLWKMGWLTDVDAASSR